jgi:hypothetical protein
MKYLGRAVVLIGNVQVNNAEISSSLHVHLVVGLPLVRNVQKVHHLEIRTCH